MTETIYRAVTLELRQLRDERRMADDLPELLREWGLTDSPQEALWVIAYDGDQRIRTVVEVARGSYHDMNVPIPVVMAAVLTVGCDRFIIAHNHPTGDVSPTILDMDVTTKIMEAANACGLFFEDHVITGAGGKFFSFAGAKLLIPSPILTAMAKTHKRMEGQRSA